MVLHFASSVDNILYYITIIVEIQYFYDDKANLSKIEYLLEELSGVVELNYDEDGNKNKIKHQGIETILENENDPLGRYFTKLVKKDNLNIFMRFYYLSICTANCLFKCLLNFFSCSYCSS